MATIRYLMDATSLSNANSTKILELEDELATALRDTVGGRDEIEVATLAEDEVLALGAHCSRIGVLFGVRNLTTWMEEDESGIQSSAWDIISALVERGRLGYKEEETVSFYCLLKITFILTCFVDGRASSSRANFAHHLEEQRFTQTAIWPRTYGR
jgi:hypothetical protein